MSEAADDGETPCCETFEPHMWKKNQCKNCFHPLPDHETLLVELETKAKEAEQAEEIQKAKEKAVDERTDKTARGKLGGIAGKFGSGTTEKPKGKYTPPKIKGPTIGKLTNNKFLSKDETQSKAEKVAADEEKKKQEAEKKHSEEEEEQEKQPTALGAELSVKDLARARFGPRAKKAPVEVEPEKPPEPEPPTKKETPGPVAQSDGKSKFGTKFGGVAKKEEPTPKPAEEPKPEPKKTTGFGSKFNKPAPAKPAEPEPKKTAAPAASKFGKPTETKSSAPDSSSDDISKLKADLKRSEEKCKQLEIDRQTLQNTLGSENDSLDKLLRDSKSKLTSLEIRCSKLEDENKILNEKIKNQKNEQMDHCDNEARFLRDENDHLKDEISDMREEMDEMYDSFREKEMDEISDLQRELEQTAKNCRVLQFKLRKEERRAEQAEKDKSEFEDRLHTLQDQFKDDDAKAHIKSLEDDLKMAKDVSVRLHEEIDLLEDKKCKTEEENRHLTELLEKADKKQFRLEMEIDKLHDKHSMPPAMQVNLAEQDQKQILRDLYDSIERENDLKDQLKFMEEEAKSMRKKLNDLDEENENLSVQLKKMSNAKQILKRADSGEEKQDGKSNDINEVDLKLLLDVTEQDLNTCTKKLREKEEENEELIEEVRFLKNKVDEKVRELTTIPAPSSPSAYYEDRLKQTVSECDDLKLKLIEKERALERLSLEVSSYQAMSKKHHHKHSKMRKSKSLDTDPAPLEIKRCIDTSQQGKSATKANTPTSATDNNDEVKANVTPGYDGSRPIPLIVVDDSAVENTELRDKVKSLEEKNRVLNDKVKLLTGSLAEVTKSTLPITHHESLVSGTDDSKSACVYEQTIDGLQGELRKLREKMEEIGGVKDGEAKSKLSNPPESRVDDGHSQVPSASDSSSGNQKGSIRDHLIDRILDLEDEADALRSSAKTRHSDVLGLQEELEATNKQMSRMQEEFRVAELGLLKEIDMAHDKISVLSDLLEMARDRAEAAEKDLEDGNYFPDFDTPPMHSASSELSVASCASDGSDDVFLVPPERRASQMSLVEKDWEAQFKKRIDCLDRLLRQERQKVDASEKKLALMANEPLSTVVSDDAKLHMREKELLQNELLESQRHLRIAVDHIDGLRRRLSYIEEQKYLARSVYTSASSMMEEDTVTATRAIDLAITPTNENKSMSSSIEAGDPSTRTSRDDEISRYKLKCEELEYKLEEINDIWLSKSKASEKERTDLEKQLREKEEELHETLVLYEQTRDDMRRMERLSQEKESVMKDMAASVSRNEDLLREHEDILKQREQDFQSSLDQLTTKDNEIKSVRENLRHRDERIREKDDIIRKLNVVLEEKQQEIKCMDDVIKQTISKLNTGSGNGYSGDFDSCKTDMEKENIRLKSDLNDYTELSEKLQDENRNVKAELDKAQQALNEAIVMWDRERSNMMARLNIANEKSRILEVSANQSEKEVVKTLRLEMHTLLEQKEKACFELHTCRKEYETCKTVQQRELTKLQEELTEKMRLLREEIINGDRLQDEIRTLTLEAELTGRLKHEERCLRKENAVMKVRYESKLGSLEYEYGLLQSAAEKLAKEKELNNDIIRGIQKGMMILRDRHGEDLIRCEEEKHILERQIEESAFIVNQLKMKIEEFKIQLADQERLRAEMANHYAAARTSWEIERAQVFSKMNEMEELLSLTTTAHSESEHKRTKIKSAWETEREEQRRLLAESHELAVGLQQQLRTRDESYVRERNELLLRLNSERSRWDRERHQKDKKIADHESCTRKIFELQKHCRELQEKLDRDATAWERERTELVRRMEMAREVQRTDAKKVEEVLSGLSRLRELSAVVSVSSRSGSSDGQTSESSVDVPMVSDGEESGLTNKMIIDYVKQAMRKIHQATETLGKYTSEKQNTRIVRRSLSSSNLEIIKDDDPTNILKRSSNMQNGHDVVETSDTTPHTAPVITYSTTETTPHATDTGAKTDVQKRHLTKSVSLDQESISTLTDRRDSDIVGQRTTRANHFFGFGSLDRLSPRTARKQFFEEESSSCDSGKFQYMSWPDRRPHKPDAAIKRHPSDGSEIKKLVDHEVSALNLRTSMLGHSAYPHSHSSSPTEENPYETILISPETSVSDVSYQSSTEVKPQPVKSKRHFFRKSHSVDNSMVGSTVAKMGVQVMMPPAAPSNTTANDILSIVKRKFRPVFKKNIDTKPPKRMRATSPDASSPTSPQAMEESSPVEEKQVSESFQASESATSESDRDSTSTERVNRKDQPKRSEKAQRSRSKSPSAQKWRSKSMDEPGKNPKSILLHAEPTQADLWKFSETSV